MVEEGHAPPGMSTVVMDSVDECNFPCSVCFQKNVKNEADKYCAICLDYFCVNCVAKTHGIGSALAGHDLLATGKMPPLPTKRCSEHGTKVIDMFCKTHEKVGCSICFILEHSK